MNINVEKTPDCRATIRVEIPAEVVKRERVLVTAKFASQAKIPGFRPGKVPVKVIEKRYQQEIESELKQQLVQKGYEESLKKENLDVLQVMEIKEPKLHEDDMFSFTAEVQTAPEVVLPQYKGIEVKIPKVEVTDHDVDHELLHMQQRMAEFVDITDRPLQAGDFAVMNYSATLDGVPLAEAVENTGYLAKATDRWMRLEDETFLPGFWEQLQGMKIGETKDVTVTLAEEFPMEALRGKTLVYSVEVTGIKDKPLPEMTDALVAEKFGAEVGTLENLRKELKEIIAGRQEQQRQEEMTTQIMEHLDKSTEFTLPEGVVLNETQRQVNDIVHRSSMRGATEDQLEENKEAIFKHATQQAEVNVKTGFILQQIAEKENIQATQEEILNAIAHLAQAARQPILKYYKQVQRERALGPIVNRIVTAKTLEFLRKEASVTEVDRPPHHCDMHGHGHDHDHDHEEEPAS